MKLILVATDFSAAASNAADYAADMALSIGADLLLLHVWRTPVYLPDVPEASSLVAFISGNESRMEELKRHLQNRTNQRVNIASEVKEGLFFKELKNTCDSLKPYAVVMGSQGTTVADHLFFGSNTIHAMQHLLWPLITVPLGGQFSHVKKIGLAVDFDKVIEQAHVEDIKKMVAGFDVQLHILNTGHKNDYQPGIVLKTERIRKMFLPVKLQFHFITEGKTDEGIIHFVEANKLDLLIVLPGRHRFLKKIFHTSFAKQMILHSHTPVLSLHE